MQKNEWVRKIDLSSGKLPVIAVKGIALIRVMRKLLQDLNN
jgi:hypothetical protein